jgi:hypothetical protein
MEYTEADLEYICSGYVSLEEACAARPEGVEQVRRLIADGLLPQPSYVLDDGTGMVPRDYFRLVDEAGGPVALRSEFERRHAAAGGDPDELDELDALERAFAPDYDRNLERFGRPPTRDLLIEAARERFPDVFSRAA